MSRFRTFLGLAAGTLMLLSAPLHAILGWKEIAAAFKAAGTPPGLVQAARLNWMLSGTAIAVFGLLTLWTFWKARRAESPSRLPTLLIGLAYAAIGAWALLETKDIFFLVFLMPCLMLLWASAGGERDRFLRLAIEGLGIFLACAAIPFVASIIWITVHTRKDGIDQGNAPACYLVLGMMLGFVIAPAYCFVRYRRFR